VPPLTAPLNPDKFPDVRPDRLRFWTLRVLAWLLSLAGLGAIGFGLAHGALAYYGTKNGLELERIVDAATLFGGSLGGGLGLLVVGQAMRVLLAIEENTRLIAFHTRPRPRPPEAAAERRVPGAERLKS
jgi:hypothetical protein